MKPTPKVGQKLYSLNVGNRARRSPQVLTPVFVISVGRKYFKTGPEMGCSEHGQTAFHLDNWREKTEYCCDIMLYESEQEWTDENEGSEICNLIYNCFDFSKNRKNLSIEKLRQIKAIIEQ